MQNNMLEYTKMILEKVSFDPQLFAKEFRKAANILAKNELLELEEWCLGKFGPDFRLVA